MPDHARPSPHPSNTPDSTRPKVAPLAPPPAFIAAATELGIDFEPGDLERLGHYLALLLETSRHFNLTAVREPDEAWMRHILDSLTLLPLLAELPENARIIDVGSGGGIPGLVLAIVMPQISITLLEATTKKADFLKSAAAALKLTNTAILNDRAEKVGQNPHHREKYDAALARAVGATAVIAELTIPFVKIGGQIYLVKGARADDELAQAKQALYLLHAAHAGTLDTATSRIVILDKQRKTPRAYPRREGEPRRRPLGT